MGTEEDMHAITPLEKAMSHRPALEVAEGRFAAEVTR